MEQKIRKRIRRIDAMQRWSRMHGWGGLVPTQFYFERATLQGLLDG